MNRAEAIRCAQREFDSGAFEKKLARLVSSRTLSKRPASGEPDWGPLRPYLDDAITPLLVELGFASPQVLENPSDDGDWPFLIAERIEDPALPTVLLYGHGDVQPVVNAEWQSGARLLDADFR